MLDWNRIQRQLAGLTGGGTWTYLAPGGVLVLLGLLILIVPRLLEAIVATALIVSGVSLLAFGWRLRQAARWRPGPWREARNVWPY